ncbi:MAG TPA: biosynthetic peptidoglycan transglycosylase [Pyrinomonadaceae bacterium]|nr:transglycosylase domain-containing protein [Chloracidobacterium sp.]HQX55149.1 biosynthetic peptidoglycan transglycosylase [Pyrinomonadaceae bacterium]MBK7802404.1 transglycosylase domain-containing protein [Chloracidobacterium sp.]MBK9437273.1 transglycosylase domain-containing protein [Chloracidobacterium sp.]MBL0239946.1 transglycosylase domain-containing protein [Chloracidobacterium sp.]
MWYWTKLLFIIFAGAVAVWIGYELITFPAISRLRTENPTTSSMIEFRISEARAEGKEPKKAMIWTPIEQISPNLQRAVLAGEDSRFFQHNGFDWDAIQAAWDEAVKEGEKEAKEEGDYDPNDWIPPMPSFKRGASTVTQQLSKNLFLSEDRNFLRKGREAVYTYFLERELTKKRILEIYLNIIEWGDGIYGAEAASRFYFKKSASDLTREDAAFLAAMIPSPLNVFNPAKNRKRVVRRQRVILRGMNSIKLAYSEK